MGDPLGWPAKVKFLIGVEMNELREKKICWLVLKWVTPSGSHFQRQKPDLKSTKRDTKNNFEVYSVWHPSKKVVSKEENYVSKESKKLYF